MSPKIVASEILASIEPIESWIREQTGQEAAFTAFSALRRVIEHSRSLAEAREILVEIESHRCIREIRAITATFLGERENSEVRALLSAGKPLRLNQLPRIEEYLIGGMREFSTTLHGVDIPVHFLGCGALPLSGLAFPVILASGLSNAQLLSAARRSNFVARVFSILSALKKTACKVYLYDRDAESCDLARRLLGALELAELFDVQVRDQSFCAQVKTPIAAYVAQLVSPKAAVLGVLFQKLSLLPGSRIIVRRTDADLRSLFYEPLERESIIDLISGYPNLRLLNPTLKASGQGLIDFEIILSE